MTIVSLHENILQDLNDLYNVQHYTATASGRLQALLSSAMGYPCHCRPRAAYELDTARASLADA